jgi:uncharacterized protein YhbP (UPF0306 family)
LAYYGIHGRDLGVSFDYRYRMLDASARFENRYFSYLRSVATRRAPTDYQVKYNEQRYNVRNVTGPVLNVSAVKAERWLERNGGRAFHIGPKAYTVYLVNWWGRKDFSFHVYRKTDAGAVDPDTGENFGTHDSRALIAWGGSTGRSWFYDLSAGPDAWSGGYDVDHVDLDQDGVGDYRMPPVWEYSKGGFRARSRLASDLGKVVRYVGLDLLFTSSPLYDPLLATPGPAGKVVVPVTMFEDNPRGSGAAHLDVSKALAQWQALEPYHAFSADVTDVKPMDPEAATSLRIFSGLTSDPSACYATGPYDGSTFAQLYCWAKANHTNFYPDNAGDHNVGVFSFWTREETMNTSWGLLGFADDNWSDGTQSYIYTFGDPAILKLGYGYTATITHEVGHHLGLSHPHDGYDPSSDSPINGGGPSYFTQVGDESNSIMSYTDLSNSFGIFDRDNLSRLLAAGYDNRARALITAASNAAGADAQTDTVIASTQGLLSQAEQAFSSWQFGTAATRARQAYVAIQSEATRLGAGKVLKVQTLSVPSSPLAPHEGDPIRFPND